MGSARFRTGNSTDALRLVLPAEKMKEKFDYMIFLARINATPGKETELPEPLLASILAVFGAKIVVQNKLPMDVRMVLRGGDLPESWFIPCFLLGILMIIAFFTKSIRTSGDNTGDL